MKLTPPQTALLWRIAEAPRPLYVHESYKPRAALQKRELINVLSAGRCQTTPAGEAALRPAWVPKHWVFRVFHEQPNSCTASVLLPDGTSVEVTACPSLQDAADLLLEKLVFDRLLPKGD